MNNLTRIKYIDYVISRDIDRWEIILDSIGNMTEYSYIVPLDLLRSITLDVRCSELPTTCNMCSYGIKHGLCDLRNSDYSIFRDTLIKYYIQVRNMYIDNKFYFDPVKVLEVYLRIDAGLHAIKIKYKKISRYSHQEHICDCVMQTIAKKYPRDILEMEKSMILDVLELYPKTKIYDDLVSAINIL